MTPEEYQQAAKGYEEIAALQFRQALRGAARPVDG